MSRRNQMCFHFVDPRLIEAVSMWRQCPYKKASDVLHELDKEKLHWLAYSHPEVSVIYRVVIGHKPFNFKELS